MVDEQRQAGYVWEGNEGYHTVTGGEFQWAPGKQRNLGNGGGGKARRTAGGRGRWDDAATKETRLVRKQ